MIKMTELTDSGVKGLRLANRTGMSVSQIQKTLIDILRQENEAFGLPIKFAMDEVRVGGMFSRTVYPCILIIHNEHESDYYQYCLMLLPENGCVHLQVKCAGRSPLAEKAAHGQLKGLGGVIRTAAFGTGERWEQERVYYRALGELIDRLRA